MVETARLQLLVASLRTPDVVRRVRLVRLTKIQWEREHPDAVRGKVQAARANEARRARKAGKDVTPKSGVTFVQDMATRLGVSDSGVERLITLSNAIPVAVLSAIAKRDEIMRREGGKGIRAKGSLLATLAGRKMRENPKLDWRGIIENHINPTVAQSVPRPGGIFMSNRVMFFGLDAKDYLKADVEAGIKYDAIIVDPPYGMRHVGRVNGAMIDDDKGSMWAVPLLAQLLKPGRPLCLWTNKGRLGHWTMALLDSGLAIHQLVRWDKGPIAQTRRYEYMLVAGSGDAPKGPSVLVEPTLPRGAPERTYHDTPKPVPLMEKVLREWTREGDVILDCFAGTASIAKAAMRLGRRCTAYEINGEIAEFASSELRKERDTLKAQARRAVDTKRKPRIIFTPMSQETA